jgi:transcriptional regulator with PAS, ATPase and Fis domain
VERIGSNQVIPIDIRVISATNKNLEEMVATREFREDLYFRLNVIPLHMPPLRDRVEDIPLLMEYFLAKHRQNTDHELLDYSPDVRHIFMKYHWPGNVRELENAIEYAVNMASSPFIGVEAIPPRITNAVYAPLPDNSPEEAHSLKDLLKRHEQLIIQEYLERYGDSLEAKRMIAEKLDIGLATLYRKLESYKLLKIEKKF